MSEVRTAVEAIPGLRARMVGAADAVEGIKSFVERRAAVFARRAGSG